MKEQTKALLTMQGTLSSVARISEHINSIIESGNKELEQKIIDSGKNINDCYKYITHKAKELATDGSCCIEDETVFGWAIHYYEDNELAEAEMKPKASTSTPSTSKTTTTTKSKTTTSKSKSTSKSKTTAKPKLDEATRQAILKALAEKDAEEDDEDSVKGFTPMSDEEWDDDDTSTSCEIDFDDIPF